MKSITIIVLFSILIMLQAQFVDPNTPGGTIPINENIGTNWTLDFSDEFEDATLNLSKWQIQNSSSSRAARPDLGIKDWWWKTENVSLSNGELLLEVVKHDSNTMYCGSVNSKDIYETTYGYFETRIKIADTSKGTHTAFWFQGQNMDNTDGTGMDGAELDIFESAWVDDYTKSVVHIDGYGSSHQANTKKYDTPNIHTGYHTWGFYWTPDFMKIYYDGTLMMTYIAELWIPKVDEYLWLSDGASFGFDPGSTNFTVEPIGTLTHAYVDYIRVWKEPSPSDTPRSNVVYNDQFENETIDGLVWKVSDWDRVDIRHEDGSNFDCKIGNLDVEEYIYQDVVVTPGETYDFSFDGKIQNAWNDTDNNHDSLGVATITGEVIDKTGTGGVLGTITTQSNVDINVSGTVAIPIGVNVVQVKISKDWNLAYVDNINLLEITVVPVANFSADKTNIIVGEKVIFTDSSTGFPTSWSWLFPGGTPSSSTVSTPKVTYNSVGNHTITLNVTNAQGSDDEIKTDYITVGNTGVIDIPILIGDDDVEEVEDGTLDTTSSDLELGYDNQHQYVGIRFQNINIPAGAVIENAYVQFQCDEVSTGALTLTISGYDTDNSAVFSGVSSVSNCPKTTAAVNWDPVDWNTIDEAGIDQRTPELKTIVQEIVDRSGWVANSSMSFIIKGDEANTNCRTAEAYSGGEPELHISYIIPIAEPTVPVNIVTSISGSNLVIDWDDSANATSYDVYSSDDPYGEFTLVTNVETNQYIVAADQAKLFYYIVATNTTK